MCQELDGGDALAPFVVREQPHAARETAAQGEGAGGGATKTVSLAQLLRTAGAAQERLVAAHAQVASAAEAGKV